MIRLHLRDKTQINWTWPACRTRLGLFGGTENRHDRAVATTIGSLTVSDIGVGKVIVR